MGVGVKAVVYLVAEGTLIRRPPQTKAANNIKSKAVAAKARIIGRNQLLKLGNASRPAGTIL
jgi:hypothetical protein